MAFFTRPTSASAAVRIVDPNTQDEPVQQPQSRKDSVTRQCRNIMIYGFCKYADKGCMYYHPPAQDASQPTTRSESPVITSSISAQAVNAPVFVPKSSASFPSFKSSHEAMRASLSSPSPSPPDYQSIQEPQATYSPYSFSDLSDSVTSQMSQLSPHFYDDPQQFNNYPSDYEQAAADIPYYSASAPMFLREPLNYHLYTPAIPSTLPFVSSSSDSHFVPQSSELRQTLQSRSETIRGVPPIGLNLPEELQGYHTLTPLDTLVGSERRKFGNWFSVVYRAINSTNGAPYALRRIENFRLMHQTAFSAIEAWSRIQHPNIVSVHEAFTTRAFNDSSLVVVYSYYPDAQTLYDVHLKPKSPPFQQAFQNQTGTQTPQFTPVPERTIWSYIIQIASAIKKVHEAKLAVRMIDTTKILVTGRNRIRIGSCGIVDVLMHDAHQDMHLSQLEDLTMFGRLIFALCCNNASATTNGNFQKSLEIMGRLYSPEIKTLGLFLISKSHPNKNINAVFEMIGTRVVNELDDALSGQDRLENELLGELENARLVRLLCKFGFINERPEFARDPRWSETGDRYIIKLFRDYVFHQIDEHGNPVTNLSHVLTCLSKLDAGTDEKVMLVARDEQSCLVVSYKEIKSCIEAAFNDLARAGR
ncbi:PAB-dependent poly(A)-specific ribonuclease subunit 3 [Stygiomarasmius scandens]|uniref:PAN2-PAN3 deadenylation complex subunit PAN3 n=1 Tax=Marasmiellus scandens TaxID=2682957 RepID=A0ABR1IXW4_9AGAR